MRLSLTLALALIALLLPMRVRAQRRGPLSIAVSPELSGQSGRRVTLTNTASVAATAWEVDVKGYDSRNRPREYGFILDAIYYPGRSRAQNGSRLGGPLEPGDSVTYWASDIVVVASVTNTVVLYADNTSAGDPRCVADIYSTRRAMERELGVLAPEIQALRGASAQDLTVEARRLETSSGSSSKRLSKQRADPTGAFDSDQVLGWVGINLQRAANSSADQQAALFNWVVASLAELQQRLSDWEDGLQHP